MILFWDIEWANQARKFQDTQNFTYPQYKYENSPNHLMEVYEKWF